MELQHINIKIPVEGELPVDPARFINTFHPWVAEQVFDEMMIDVLDYRHVPAGPGVVAVGLEADYGMDNGGGRWGLLYNRKAALDGSNADRFAQALAAAARACSMLEAEYQADGLKFSRTEFELIVNDRALAPNTAETFAACKADLEKFLKTELGHDGITIEQQGDARTRFAVSVKSDQAFDLAAIQSAST